MLEINFACFCNSCSYFKFPLLFIFLSINYNLEHLTLFVELIFIWNFYIVH